MPQSPRTIAGRTGVTPGAPLRLFAVVLAAGSSSRFGTVKQLASYHGIALVARAMRDAERLCADRSVLVTGFAGDKVHACCAPLRGFLVYNTAHATGISSSIRHGVAAVRDVADGVLLMLADQPLVPYRHLQALAAQWQATPQRIVASRYAATFGVPAIFPAADFDALAQLKGDHGAKKLLATHDNRLELIDCAAAAVDIDYPAELDALA